MQTVKDLPQGQTVVDALLERFRDNLGDETIQALLRTELAQAGLTTASAVRKIRDKMDAQKTLTIAGQAHTQDDNDAQLRAVEQAIKLMERAGTMPSAPQSVETGSQITVNVMNFNIDLKS